MPTNDYNGKFASDMSSGFLKLEDAQLCRLMKSSGLTDAVYPWFEWIEVN
jgi:hypothetical protein